MSTKKFSFAALLVIGLSTVSTLVQADSFKLVEQAVKADLVANGQPANWMQPNTNNANQLKAYLKVSCLYRTKTESSISANGSIFSNYEEWVLFNPDGSFKITGKTTLGGGAGGVSIDDRGKATVFQGMWSTFEISSAAKMVIVLRVNGQLQPFILNGLDSGAISFVDSGDITRYQRLNRSNC